MSLWVFVRHGQSVANRERWYSGQTDVPLTEAGRAAAASLGAQLAGVPFTRAVSSDLRRARDTARLILGDRDLNLSCSSALRERDVGEWTGRLLDELDADARREVMHGWHAAPPGGESLAQVTRRAVAWLATLPPSDGPTLLVAHGGTLRGLLGLVDGTAGEQGTRKVLENTAPEVRELAPDAWRQWEGWDG